MDPRTPWRERFSDLLWIIVLSRRIALARLSPLALEEEVGGSGTFSAFWAVSVSMVRPEWFLVGWLGWLGWLLSSTQSNGVGGTGPRVEVVAGRGRTVGIDIMGTLVLSKP